MVDYSNKLWSQRSFSFILFWAGLMILCISLVFSGKSGHHILPYEISFCLRVVLALFVTFICFASGMHSFFRSEYKIQGKYLLIHQYHLIFCSLDMTLDMDQISNVCLKRNSWPAGEIEITANGKKLTLTYAISQEKALYEAINDYVTNSKKSSVC